MIIESNDGIEFGYIEFVPGYVVPCVQQRHLFATPLAYH